jgi:formyl-CoA transferase/CoA:oxalate CoA-transferase
LLLALCAKADVLIEKFRPGTMQRLGLGDDVLQKSNPDLVVCSISGFSQSRPLRDKIAYDVITQAMFAVYPHLYGNALRHNR